MQLTRDQDSAVKFLVDFVGKPFTNDITETEAVLSGFAGTGKSTIMNVILRQIKSNVRVSVSAPTHTAKEIIAAFTGRQAETIQALLGLRPNINLENFDPTKPEFAVMGKEKIQNYNLLVIDEASMLGKDLVRLIREAAFKYRVKVIYMGDKYQLPPVGEKLSVVFELKNMVTLNEVVRQKSSNPNLKIIELARNDVRDKTNLFPEYIKSIKRDMNEKEGFVVLKDLPFYDKMLELYFDTEYQHNPLFVKTIAWTNNTVKKLNLYFRSKLIPSTDLIAKNDKLVGYRTIVIERSKTYVELLRNSKDYIVESVDTIENELFGRNFKYYHTVAENEIEPMNILHRDSYNDFIEEYRDRLFKAQQFHAWKGYYDFINKFLLMDDLVIDGKPRPKDIDYGYAITVHKSQGSTYKHVGIILPDIQANYNKEEGSKLSYVAISRTQETNTIYG